jgi:hypothetical protein
MKSARLRFWAGILVIGAAAFTATAQTGQLRTFVPEPAFAELSYSHTGKTDLDSGAKYARYDVQYHGEMPLILDDPLRLAVFGDARWTRISLENTPVDDLDVYKGLITLDTHHEGFYPFLVHGQLSAGLLSDLKEIDGNDARVRGKALVEYPVTQGFSLLAGGAYDEAFGDDEWHLAGGLRWKPTPELLLDLQYPKSQAVFAPTKGVAFTVSAGYAGDNWAIFHDKQEYNLRIKGFATEAGAEFALSDSLWVRLSAGWLTERSVDIWKADRRPVKGDADDNYVAGIALLWR